MASYLTADQIIDRLADRFGITALVLDGDAEVASDQLDALRPFVGTKLVTDGSQEREFPRSVNPDGTTNVATTPPSAVLDWVAMCAYRLATDDAPPVTSEGAGSVNISYATPKPSQAERRMEYLLAPYFLRMGQRSGAAYVLQENP